MMTCSDGHQLIRHDEFHCPLCAEMQDRAEADDTAHRLQGELDRLRESVDELGLADVLQLLAQVDVLETRAYEADRKLSAIRWDVEALLRRQRTKADLLAQLTRISRKATA